MSVRGSGREGRGTKTRRPSTSLGRRRARPNRELRIPGMCIQHSILRSGDPVGADSGRARARTVDSRRTCPTENTRPGKVDKQIPRRPSPGAKGHTRRGPGVQMPCLGTRHWWICGLRTQYVRVKSQDYTAEGSLADPAGWPEPSLRRSRAQVRGPTGHGPALPSSRAVYGRWSPRRETGRNSTGSDSLCMHNRHGHGSLYVLRPPLR